jgi:hypothetical protein
MACAQCGSRDTRRVPAAATRTRADVIADYIGTTIDDILDECPYWKMAPGDTEPRWAEIRDAIIAKVFAVEHEMGRAEPDDDVRRAGCNADERRGC